MHPMNEFINRNINSYIKVSEVPKNIIEKYLNVEHKEPKFFKPDEQPNARYQLKETMPLLIPIGVMILMVIVTAIID